MGALLWGALSVPGWGAVAAQDHSPDLSSLSLEQLTQVEISVNSFSRKDQDLWVTPAAVYVISKEAIAQSAATSIPELLRGVPGLQVAQINASTWAVSVRGFNSVFASKLLVLVDGRTVYSEIYSGTHWDQIDLPLEAVERIEVIRGPGAAVWGTNAVNGVINIISKPAQHTTGMIVSGVASRIDDVALLGYGGAVGDRFHYRAFAKYVRRNPFVDAAGVDAFDGERTWRVGGQALWSRSEREAITVNWDSYGGKLKSTIVPGIALAVGPNGMENESMDGGSTTVAWECRTDKTSRTITAYTDEQVRHELASLAQSRSFDLDYQEHHVAWPRHDAVWGGEFRYTLNHVGGAVLPTALPYYGNYLVDGFVQDEIGLVPKRLMLTVGSKLQEGTLAGFQMQPSVRILWAPDRAQTVWASVSRASVAPSLQDRDAQIPLSLGEMGGLPVVGRLQGNPAFKPELVIAYEAGYRRRLGSSLTLDLAGFFNDNHRIQSTATTASYQAVPYPAVFAVVGYTNGFRAKTGGIEASAKWNPLSNLTFEGNYAWMEARTTQVDAGSVVITDDWNTPHNSFKGIASWALGARWTANAVISYVGGLAAGPVVIDSYGNGGDAVPAYRRLDLHVAHKVGRALELEAGGTNLLSPRHQEFGGGTSFVTPYLVPRSSFVKGTWTF